MSIRSQLILKQQEFNVTDSPVYVKEDKTDNPVPTSKDTFEDVVFALDPKTRLPCSDIGQLIGRQTDPEVRNYIMQQFMNPVPSTGVPVDSGLDLSEFQRLPYEDNNQYLQRVTKIFDDAKEQLNSLDNDK